MESVIRLCMLVLRPTAGATDGCRLHEQAFERDRLPAFDAVAIDAPIKSADGGRDAFQLLPVV